MNSISFAGKQPGRLLEIDQTRSLSVRVPAGSAVHCIAGRAWLTQEGLLDDVVLAAGEKFAVRQKGIVVMSGIRGAALVYLSAGTQVRADEAVISTPDFLDAAHTRAARLRREELARLAGAAWGFVMRLVKRTKTIWKQRSLGFACAMRYSSTLAELHGEEFTCRTRVLTDITKHCGRAARARFS